MIGQTISHYKILQKVFSPLVPAGEADILVALEKLEGLRWAHFVRNEGLIVLNTEERTPARVDEKPINYPPKHRGLSDE